MGRSGGTPHTRSLIVVIIFNFMVSDAAKQLPSNPLKGGYLEPLVVVSNRGST